MEGKINYSGKEGDPFLDSGVSADNALKRLRIKTAKNIVHDAVPALSLHELQETMCAPKGWERPCCNTSVLTPLPNAAVCAASILFHKRHGVCVKLKEWRSPVESEQMNAYWKRHKTLDKFGVPRPCALCVLRSITERLHDENRARFATSLRNPVERSAAQLNPFRMKDDGTLFPGYLLNGNDYTMMNLEGIVPIFTEQLLLTDPEKKSVEFRSAILQHFDRRRG